MCSGPKENVLKILLVIEAFDDDDRILRNGNVLWNRQLMRFRKQEEFKRLCVKQLK